MSEEDKATKAMIERYANMPVLVKVTLEPRNFFGIQIEDIVVADINLKDDEGNNTILDDNYINELAKNIRELFVRFQKKVDKIINDE